MERNRERQLIRPEHSALDYQTPFAYLKSQMPNLDDGIRYVVPVILDDISIHLGHWIGYNVLAQNPIKESCPEKFRQFHLLSRSCAREPEV